MAVTTAVELELVADVTAKLKGLLEQARSLKSENTVEPPLPTKQLADGLDTLHDRFDDAHDQTNRFFTVETAARELFYSLIYQTKITDPAFVELWNLLDIVLLCGDCGKCTPELVCWLLEELLDSQTTHGCRIVFDYLESRRERLAQKDFHKKNLIFLRSCNELLRRLSRAEDAIFCGRVFFFLFQTFPLGDKSSVNLRGEFHVENTTNFEPSLTRNEDSQMEDVRAKSVLLTDGEPAARSNGGSKKSHNAATPVKPPPKKAAEEEVIPSETLYPIFWRLQHDFSDPTQLYEAENFARFQDGLEKTIIKFKKTPTLVQTKAAEEDKRGVNRETGDDGTNDGTGDMLLDNYNPKYLTSPELFDLELSDLAFQRHILVQALILIDFLLSLTEQAKKRLAALPSVNRSMLYNFTLSDEDTTWANATRSNITSYLGLTQEGRQYCRMVETVLARDKNWVRWKVESCPSIVRGPTSTEEELAARKGAREAVRPRKTQKQMGGIDLSFLDEGKGGGLEALKMPSRFTTPSIEELVNGVRTDKLDAEMAMDEEEKTMFDNAMTNKTWRALRQARAIDLSLLDKVEPGKDLEEIFTHEDNLEEAAAAELGSDETGQLIPSAIQQEDSSLEQPEAQENNVMEGTGETV